MAGVSETRTWDALLTTTLANYRKKLIDNIFDTYPTLSWLNGKLGEAMRGAKRLRLLDGGRVHRRACAVRAVDGRPAVFAVSDDRCHAAGRHDDRPVSRGASTRPPSASRASSAATTTARPR